ncbi:MAG: AAA family ATPase [Leptolyngbyaceae bacterium]|nr:AAA family ATPase [Leptolyngbyaceae bacterium]
MMCSLMVGIPGSGKSTFAAQLLNHYPHYRLIATDDIRQALYGDAAIQGDWAEVERQVLIQVGDAIASGIPVIYDATNFKREHRIDLLQKLHRIRGHHPVSWVAWYLTTPLEVCQIRNQQRSRQVPPDVISAMFRALQEFPPTTAEGFAQVYTIAMANDPIDVQALMPNF